MAPINFTLKNLIAEEFPFNTGTTKTLGDLREFIVLRLRIPPYLIKLVCNGRTYTHRPDSVPIESMLKEGDLVWLLWMGDSDYSSPTHHCIFYAQELEAKQRRYGETFEYITLRAYKTIGWNLAIWRASYEHDRLIEDPNYVPYDYGCPRD